MQSSDEDFESADEGSNVDRKERKKRLSSSNYSDNALESDQEFKTPIKTACKPSETKPNTSPKTLVQKETDGWDDFEIDENESIDTQEPLSKTIQEPFKTKNETEKDTKTSEDTAWDDFGDWGQEDSISNAQKEETKPIQTLPQSRTQPTIKETAATGGWGWGWSVDSLLSTATAGITNITTQMSQGISTVLETGIGAPDPEELAKASKENQAKRAQAPEELGPTREIEKEEEAKGSGGDAFQLGSLLSGVTKFVESTEILEWLEKASELTDRAVYKRCVSALAQTTALSVQTYHKTGELLLTKQRRSTADEADALTQMTVVLKKHISSLATLFTEKLNSLHCDGKEQDSNYTTNIFLEAGNSSTYVQNAFQLALPILQIGAV